MKRLALKSILLCLTLTGNTVSAAIRYWDPDQNGANNDCGTGVGMGGNGAWSTAQSRWVLSTACTGASVVWVEGDDAVFWGTAGNPTLSGPRTAGDLTFKTDGYLVSASTLTLAGAGKGVIAVDTGAATLGTLLAGTIGYTKFGAGTLILTNSGNTITGPVLVGGGILSLTTSGKIGGTGVGSGNITLDGGTLRNTDSASSYTFLTSNRQIIIGANGGTVDTPNTIGIYNGVISGTGNTLTKIGAGEFRALNNWSFGKLVVNQGLYRINGTGGGETGFGAVPAVTTPDAITINNGASIGQSLSITLDSKRGITLGVGGGGFNTSAASLTIPSTITGPGALLKNTSGTLTLNGANDYEGITLVGGGKISVGSATALGSTLGYTDVASGGEILFTGAATAFVCNEPFSIAGVGAGDNGAIAVIASASPTLSGPITLTGDATVTVASTSTAIFNHPQTFTSIANQNLTLQGGAGAGNGGSISGIIALGAGGLTKLQSGTWNLSGVNTFTGPTTISAGRLNMNSPGSLAAGSAVTVSSGATLGGSGTINGPVTVDGTLAPGAFIGTLTLDLSPTLNGTVSMEINKAAGPVLSADKLVVSGNPLAFAGTLTVSATGDAFTGGEVFDLFDATSFSGAFSPQNLPSLGTGLNWYTGNLAVDGSIKVNRAPTGGADILSTATNAAASITANKLRVNDSDADGDTLSVTAVSVTSAQGGTVTLSLGTVSYTPPTSFGGADSFTYTLDDAHGGSTVVTVNVTIGGGTSQGANAVFVDTQGGEFIVRFAGVPGQIYTVEHSAGPTGPWAKYGGNKTAPADNSLGFGIGVFEVRENTGGSEAGFYRTVHPAY